MRGETRVPFVTEGRLKFVFVPISDKDASLANSFLHIGGFDGVVSHSQSLPWFTGPFEQPFVQFGLDRIIAGQAAQIMKFIRVGFKVKQQRTKPLGQNVFPAPIEDHPKPAVTGFCSQRDPGILKGIVILADDMVTFWPRITEQGRAKGLAIKRMRHLRRTINIKKSGQQIDHFDKTGIDLAAC